MATSVRESILASLKTALALISTANGYENNITGGVQRFNQNGNSLVTVPTIVVIGGSEEKSSKEAHNLTDCKLTVYLVAWARHDSESVVDTDTVVNSLILDVEKAIMVDVTRGGKAVDTNVVNVEPLDSVEGQPYCGAILEVEIWYRHTITDPATAR